MNMPTVEIPQNKKKLQQQIAVLEWQIGQDTNDIDRRIHERSLYNLKESDKIND